MSIKLNAQSGGSVALDAPTQTTGSADNVYKLPVADGSAGQVLKTDGSGNLSWVTLTEDCVKLASSNVSPSDATFTYDSLNNTTYHYYKLIWQGVPNVDNTNLRFRWRTGSADITDTLYSWTNIGVAGNNGAMYDNVGNSDDSALIAFSGGNQSGEGWNVELTLKPQQAQPLSGSSVFAIIDRVDGSSHYKGETNHSRLRKDVSPNGFKIFPASGTFAQYQYTLYGFKK
tara:strand:+ start:1517 stop:2203 length:687 start_codon:yes stop_codon:yes gene_type:complete